MSLYNAGLKKQTNQQRTRIGDAGSVEPFSYPPKNTHDALIGQKAFLMSKNGFFFTARDIKDVPKTNIADAWVMYKFWNDLAPVENQPTAMRNALLKAKAAIVKSASAYLSIPYGVAPSADNRSIEQKADDIKRIANLLGLKDAIVGMSQGTTLAFWQGMYRFEHELTHLPPGRDKLNQAWDSLTESWDELPGRLQAFGKGVANVIVKPIADAAGTGAGSFFEGFFSGLKTPIGIAGAGLVGYLGYRYFQNRRGPAIVINRKRT